MGVVYKAEDIRLHRFVALKFLPDEVADGQAFIAMEFLEGVTLSSRPTVRAFAQTVNP